MSALLPIARTALAALALSAIGQQFLLHSAAAHSTLNFCSYFTNLSNLVAALVLLLSALFRAAPGAALDVMRYLSAVNMVVVGVVFAVLLRDVDLGDLLPWVNVVLHYVMPVAIVLDWVLDPPVTRLRTGHLAGALVFPAAYLVYALLRGAAIGWYPYPFLDPEKVGGYAGVAVYAAGIFVTFLVAGVALLAAGNRLPKASPGRWR